MAVKMRGDCQFALVTPLSHLLSDFSKILYMDYFNDDHQNDRHLSVRNYAYSDIVTYHLVQIKKLCSTQLSIELQMLITAKMLKIKECYCFQTLICCIYHANKLLKCNNCQHFNIYDHYNFYAHLN